jgi:dephospho-CoA kinase
LLEKAKASAKDAVIESIRAVGEVEKLKQDEEFVLFAVDAEPKKRYERNSKRGTVTDNEKDFEEFLAREKREMENTDPTKQNLKGCISLADYKFNNDGTIEELYSKVEGVIDELRKEKD